MSNCVCVCMCRQTDKASISHSVRSVCQRRVDIDGSKLDGDSVCPVRGLIIMAEILLIISTGLSICLCCLSSTVQKQMSGRRYGTWHTPFCLLSFSISLTRFSTAPLLPPPPPHRTTTHMRACTVTHNTLFYDDYYKYKPCYYSTIVIYCTMLQWKAQKSQFNQLSVKLLYITVQRSKVNTTFLPSEGGKQEIQSGWSHRLRFWDLLHRVWCKEELMILGLNLSCVTEKAFVTVTSEMHFKQQMVAASQKWLKRNLDI